MPGSIGYNRVPQRLPSDSSGIRRRSLRSASIEARTTLDKPMATGSSTDLISPAPVSILPVPPLEPGDRLSRAEFERRYTAMRGLKKAELIEGTVYMASPVRFTHHGEQNAYLLWWLLSYKVQTPGVAVADNTTLRLDQKNEPQPDAFLMIETASGGQARIDRDGYIEGAPELVAEIASSTVSIDLHDKLEVYRRNGVREYIAWRVLDRAVDWFALRDGQYQRLAPDNEGILRSEVFPGLWLHFPAMLEGKLDVVLATLERGIGTPEHHEFVAKLQPTQT